MNVLVVDDTKNIRRLLTTCLEMEGWTVKTAGEGKTALQLISQESFDLVFLDIKLPLFSGTDVLREMRNAGIDTPVIIVTAYATVKNAVECTNLGAVAYLQKPFTAEKIRSVLNELLNLNVQKSGAGKRLAAAKNQIGAGRYKEAERILKSAVAEDPLLPDLYLLLSQASRGLENEAEALKYEKIYKALL
jgi:two-component system OmpR family response regulator